MDVNVLGVNNLSTSDWPGRSSITIFLAGCPLACPRCHNQGMEAQKVPIQKLGKMIRENSIYADSLILSGGEPLLQAQAIPEISAIARDVGLSVGIETSGVLPGQLEFLCQKKAIDMVFLDLKADIYDNILLRSRTGGRLEELSLPVLNTLSVIAWHLIPVEFRMTIFPDYPSEREIYTNFSVLAAQFLSINVPISFRLLVGRPAGGAEFTPLTEEQLQKIADSIGGRICNRVFVGNSSQV